MLKCVVFNIKNGLDINYLAVKNKGLWTILGSDRTFFTAPETFDEIKRVYKREDFFPAELFYELS